MTTIHFERRGRVAIYTMQGDTDLNLGVVDEELHEKLLEYREDGELWCAVITGAGTRAFSAGADLKEIASKGGVRKSVWQSRSLNLMSGMEFWKPLVAAVNGHALGLGMMLALACDIRVASESATFALPEVKYGFPPGNGATLRLPRVMPLGPALEVLLVGDRISAQQALAWGLVNHVYAQDELVESAVALAQRIASNPPIAVRACKELAIRGLEMPLEHGFRLEALISGAAHGTEDAKEGPLAFKERRPPEFKGR